LIQNNNEMYIVAALVRMCITTIFKREVDFFLLWFVSKLPTWQQAAAGYCTFATAREEILDVQ
jgi:hypothetical protein